MSNPWEIKTIEYDKTNSEGNADATGYGQISILLSKYVLKEKGKGLSSNDFTNSDKLKLDSVEIGAQENKVETLTVNQGQKIYPNSDKNIDITVPTRVGQLTNDLGYAKLANMSTYEDYSDSYVGKAKFAFQDEENIAIGKNANANEGGIAIGVNTTTNETYDVNINNQLLHNQETDIWEGKISESEVANKNSNGTDLIQLDTVINNLAIETQNRIDGDTTLQNNINNEVQNRIDGDDLLTINLNAEVQNRTNADNGLSNRIISINNLIPNQASSENQLADKSFVNSTVQTNTANFRGNWNDWSDVPTDENDYPQDYSGSKIPTVNDYLVVRNASDYTLETLNGTWRFKYVGVWETDGKNGWIPEYQVNEEPFTSEQLYAINSGITSDKVSEYDSHLIDTSNPHEVTKSQVGLGNVTNVSTESVITEDSNNNITSGAVYTAFANEVSARNTAIENAIKDLDVSSVGGEGKYISAISENDGKISATSTTMDSSPTTDSNNAVTSSGIKSAISTAESNAKNLANATNTLSIAHGGTGGTTATEAEYNILGSVPTVDTSLSDSKYIALRNQTLSSSNGTYRWTSCDNVVKYTESNYPYGVCTTNGDVASKTVTCNNFTLTEGIRFTVKFTNDNTATNPTLTVNSENPYPIYYKGTSITNSLITANTLITFRFNGEEYDVVGEFGTSSSSVTGVKGEAENSYRTGNVNITKSNLGLTTITQAEINSGTSTDSRLVTPKLLADNYNKKSSVTNHTLYL